MRNIVVLVWMLFSVVSGSCFAADTLIKEDFVAGKVIAVSDLSVNQELLKHTGMVSKHQMVQVEVLEGPLLGQTFEVPNEITDNPSYNVIVRPGREVILSIATAGNGKPEINISDYRREPVLMWLLAAFLLIFVLFGGKQGIKSLGGLVVCVLMIAFVLLPLSLKGVNPLVTATVICFASTIATMVFSAGFTRKALAAMIGTGGGVILAGIAAHIVISQAPLIGLSSEEAQILRASMLSQPPAFYSGLLAAGMLIGALGVIMDVGISVASSIWEVSRSNQSLHERALYRSGMNVGRDIMGTMTTTLVLAYAGSALPLLLLAAQMPSVKLLNLDLVATEITAALAGSLGLVFTIPLTALVAAKMMAGSSGSPLSTATRQDAGADTGVGKVK